MKIDWLIAARDALLIEVLLSVVIMAIASAIGGFSLSQANTATFLILTVGFCVAGCLKPVGRFPHLAVVAVLVILIGTVVNGLSRGFAAESLGTMLLGALPRVVGAMLVGGAISLAIVRTPPAAGGGEDSGSSQA